MQQSGLRAHGRHISQSQLQRNTEAKRGIHYVSCALLGPRRFPTSLESPRHSDSADLAESATKQPRGSNSWNSRRMRSSAMTYSPPDTDSSYNHTYGCARICNWLHHQCLLAPWAAPFSLEWVLRKGASHGPVCENRSWSRHRDWDQLCMIPLHSVPQRNCPCRSCGSHGV